MCVSVCVCFDWTGDEEGLLGQEVNGGSKSTFCMQAHVSLVMGGER